MVEESSTVESRGSTVERSASTVDRRAGSNSRPLDSLTVNSSTRSQRKAAHLLGAALCRPQLFHYPSPHHDDARLADRVGSVQGPGPRAVLRDGIAGSARAARMSPRRAGVTQLRGASSHRPEPWPVRGASELRTAGGACLRAAGGAAARAGRSPCFWRCRGSATGSACGSWRRLRGALRRHGRVVAAARRRQSPAAADGRAGMGRRAPSSLLALALALAAFKRGRLFLGRRRHWLSRYKPAGRLVRSGAPGHAAMARSRQRDDSRQAAQVAYSPGSRPVADADALLRAELLAADSHDPRLVQTHASESATRSAGSCTCWCRPSRWSPRAAPRRWLPRSRIWPRGVWSASDFAQRPVRRADRAGRFWPRRTLLSYDLLPLTIPLLVPRGPGPCGTRYRRAQRGGGQSRSCC